MTTNNNKAVQLVCTINENDEVIFNNYSLIDQDGNQVVDNESWFDDIINNDLSGVVVDTLRESLRENGVDAFSTSLFFINIALTSLQNFNETGDNGYKDEIIAGISTVVEVGISTAYGFAGAAAGAPGGPITSVAGAVSFSYAATEYYNNNVEPGFNDYLNQTYDYLFNSDSDEVKTITYDPQTSSTYTVKPGDTISKIAQDLGITTQQLIDSNPYLMEENRISEDGKFIFIKEGEKLSVNINDIKNSIKIDNGAINLDNDDISDNNNDNQGEQGNIYNKELLTDLLLNQNNDSLFLNLKDDFNDDGNSWQSIEDIKNKDIKLEFDFDTNFKKVNGLDDTYDNPLNVNNNSLKLTINTDKTQDFSPTENNQLGQDGLVIGDADWGALVPFINDDGYNNAYL